MQCLRLFCEYKVAFLRLSVFKGYFNNVVSYFFFLKGIYNCFKIKSYYFKISIIINEDLECQNRVFLSFCFFVIVVIMLDYYLYVVLRVIFIGF